MRARRVLATLTLAASIGGIGTSSAQASPWVPDFPTGPCPYAGCDDWTDWLPQ